MKVATKIAVIGGGISGLVSALELSRDHNVQLFEAASHLGGHTYTTSVEEGDHTLEIDMGFIVFNDWTYPNFIRLLEKYGVDSQPSSMSFSVHCEKTGLEYNGTTINQLFAQRRNLLRPSFYRMIADILRFHRVAPSLLDEEGELTVGEFLEQERFHGPFVEHYLVPMIAAIWSTAPGQMHQFPIRTLITFLQNHGMLSVDDRPQWRVIQGGSKRYVEAFSSHLQNRIALSTPIEWIRRTKTGVEIKPVGGIVELFDAVVLATHSDQALKLLADPTPEERAVLGAIPYQNNEVVLHTDRSFLPQRKLAWASWNYHLPAQPTGEVTVTYYMNLLQSLDAKKHYCVTLNRTSEIDPESVLRKVDFAHPLYTREGIAAQKRWADISYGKTWYCGAYWGYGFHEDGVKSGFRVAEALNRTALERKTA